MNARANREGQALAEVSREEFQEVLLISVEQVVDVDEDCGDRCHLLCGAVRSGNAVEQERQRDGEDPGARTSTTRLAVAPRAGPHRPDHAFKGRRALRS